jgi:hypothetical protein
MNDIIKQFEKQCWNHQAWQLDAEKFAELILQECCLVIDKHYEPVYDGSILKQYFGVK